MKLNDLPIILRIEKAYKNQIMRAKQRGIEFKITFEEWVTWWESNLGTDWFSKRGIKSGQYVMARNNDRGPYTITNIKCITVEENHRQRSFNNTVGNRKLTETQVKEIIAAKGTYPEIAKRFGVSKWHIGDIKRGERWTHLKKKKKGCKISRGTREPT